jgi:hypothetical protein
MKNNYYILKYRTEHDWHYLYSISNRCLAVFYKTIDNNYYVSVQDTLSADGGWIVINHICSSFEEANNFIINKLKEQDHHLIPPALEMLL